MGTNFERFLHILSKWPAEIRQASLDYGGHLRQLLKLKDASGNVFPGNSVENSKMLDSLLRLVNNTYIKKYPCSMSTGASTMDENYINDVLESAVKKMEQEKEKQKRNENK